MLVEMFRVNTSLRILCNYTDMVLNLTSIETLGIDCDYKLYVCSLLFCRQEILRIGSDVKEN